MEYQSRRTFILHVIKHSLVWLHFHPIWAQSLCGYMYHDYALSLGVKRAMGVKRSLVPSQGCVHSRGWVYSWGVPGPRASGPRNCSNPMLLWINIFKYTEKKDEWVHGVSLSDFLFDMAWPNTNIRQSSSSSTNGCFIYRSAMGELEGLELRVYFCCKKKKKKQKTD